MKLAKLYDYTSQLIAVCTNTPQAIAKAAQEHPEVRFYIGGRRRTTLFHVSELTPYMTSANNAKSGYTPVAGVVPAVDSFDPSDFIEA